MDIRIVLATRRAALTPAQFEADIEARAAALAPLRTQRRYVRREVSPITGAAIAVPFDAMIECAWDTGAAQFAARDRWGDDAMTLRVAECDTPMRGWSAGESLFKQVYLLKRRPGLSRAEFRRRYEEEHVPDGARRMPQARRYLRRYVVDEPDGAVSEPPFDVLLEVWWGSRSESEAAIRALASNGEMQAIRDDSEGIFASPDHPLFTVEERGLV